MLFFMRRQWQGFRETGNVNLSVHMTAGVSIAADPTIAPETFYRVTADGDRRVTSTGDARTYEV